MLAHRINRVEIELTVGDTARAATLSGRLSSLHEQAIAPLLLRVFDAFGSPDVVERMSSVELDLGELSEESFDAQFLDRLEEALRAELARQLRGRTRGEVALASATEVVEVFARTGALVWWAGGGVSDGVSRRLAWLAAEAPAALLALARELVDDADGLTRLAQQCDDATIDALIEQVASAAAPTAIAVRLLRSALIAGTPGGALAAASARSDLHRAVLVVLPTCDARSASAIVRALVDELVARRPLAVEALARLCEGHDAPIVSEVAAVLRDSLSAAHRALASSAGPGARGPSVTAGSEEAGRPAEGPDPQSEAARETGRDDAGAPAPGDRIAARGDSRRASVALPADSTPTRGAPASPRTSAHRGPRGRSHEQLDELYVENAGLVILWPFLERFFTRVELVGADRRFLEEEASMQAIALLEGIATDELEPPEFRLPLAKLLCGRDPRSLFRRERAFTEAQITECEHLLPAVIKRAPVLRDMTIPTFKTTFLQRPGVLTIRDGAWLLQVERRSHDVVLDRFPWSWGWVKMAWMPDPLQVEW